MYLLDQLEQQARDKQAREEELAIEARERSVRYHSIVEPAMQRLLDYLKQLASHLNFLEQQRQFKYQLPHYGAVSATSGADLKTQFSSQENHSEIRLNATAQISQKQSPVVFLRAPFAEQFNELLSELGLHAKKESERNSRGQMIEASFQVYGTVNISVSIRADLDNDDLMLEFINVDRIGSYRRRVDPARVDDVFLDGLGRFISRDRDALTQEELPAEIRERLRRGVAQEKYFQQKPSES